MTSKRKRSTYLDTDRTPIESEADLLTFLTETERNLVAEYPRIDEESWRLRVMLSDAMVREELAIDLLARTRDLRERVQADMPAWEAAARGMAWQDRLMRYQFPEFRSEVGRIESERKQPRKANDELAVSVLRSLRLDRGLTCDEAIKEMKRAAYDLIEFGGIEVDYIEADDKVIFRRGDRKTESFTTSTLQRKKWRKAGKRTDTP